MSTVKEAQLIAALKPFAALFNPEHQDFIGDPSKIEVGNFGTITLDDLLRARAALAGEPK